MTLHLDVLHRFPRLMDSKSCSSFQKKQKSEVSNPQSRDSAELAEQALLHTSAGHKKVTVLIGTPELRVICAETQPCTERDHPGAGTQLCWTIRRTKQRVSYILSLHPQGRYLSKFTEYLGCQATSRKTCLQN